MKIINKISYFKAFVLTFIIISFSAPQSYGQSTGLIINELMINPKSAILPEYEYIELHNFSNFNYNLHDYKLVINNRTLLLPSYYLAKGQYIILTDHKASPYFERFGNVIGLDSWPPLNNSSASIMIIDSEDNIIDIVEYTDAWYGDTRKKSGGWSLERINPQLSCNIRNNWSASVSRNGGTPGKKNSLYDRNRLPTLEIDILEVLPSSILLRSEPASSFTKEDITLSPDIGSPVLIDTIEENILKLTFQKEITKDKRRTLEVKAAICNIENLQTTFDIFISEEPEYNDLIISELLTNPKEGGVKFVEIYNSSNRTFDLQEWYLGNRQISATPHYIHPFEYRVLTTDKYILSAHYPSTKIENTIALSSLPSFAIHQGNITLFYQTSLIDSLHYSSDMHQPFIKNHRGISLERQFIKEDSNSKGNFTSAATAVGGATPGFENSKIREQPAGDNYFEPQSRVFSSTAADYNSSMTFDYNINMVNAMCNFHLYNEKGILVKRLIENKSLATNGAVTWDGKDDQGHPCPSGLYIYTIEIYNDLGETLQFKKSFAIVNNN